MNKTQAAEYLKISESTLHRKLKRAGTSWSAVMDQFAPKQPTVPHPNNNTGGVIIGSAKSNAGVAPIHTATSHLSSQPATPVFPPGNDPAHANGGGAIPSEIQQIAQYMQYFAALGLNVKFNEILAYLKETQQLLDQGGSELAQQMSTADLLAVIKPSASLPPVNSLLTSSSEDSTSLIPPASNK